MRALYSFVALAFFAGCSPADRPPLTPDPQEESGPVLLDDGRPDPIPRSIRRIISEDHEAMADIRSLLPLIGDARGRARATQAADGLAAELANIEARIDATNGESDGLDLTFDDLRRVTSKIDLLHQTLRSADLRASN